MSLSDRRRFPRFPFHSRGSLGIGASDHRGTLIDISYRGALFISDATFALQVGTDCCLNVYYGWGKPFLAIGGRAVDVQDHVVGLEFAALTETMEQSLRCLVDLNLGMPQLLDRALPALLRPPLAEARHRRH